MSDRRPTDNADITQYFADKIAEPPTASGGHDFVLKIDGNQIAYVDVEGCTVWLLTVEEAKFVVAGESA
jgi:hypothetical protein